MNRIAIAQRTAAMTPSATPMPTPTFVPVLSPDDCEMLEGEGAICVGPADAIEDAPELVANAIVEAGL